MVVSEHERYPGNDHAQIYWSWRHYPRAMRLTLLLGLMFGLFIGFIVGLAP